MIRNIKQFQNGEYDLLIIGGGINGAAIANIAARYGKKVALVEKGDFSGGTSSKSTKLIHGGLRYLENFEFDLVSESLKERSIQLLKAPHLVRPLSFIIPVYKNGKRPLWMVKLGVALYDFLSGKHVLEKHRPISAEEIINSVKGIKKDGLLGGVVYPDAQMNDARLCLENILMAAHKGADVANYVEVIEIIKENGIAIGVRVNDLIGDKDFVVKAKRIVCAAGPWANSILHKDIPGSKERVRTTKGIHIVYQEQFSEKALLITNQGDERVFFIIPWFGNSLIGTTDTDFKGSPDDVQVEREDIDYLFKEAQRVLPGAHFTVDKIITSFAGLRPLVHQKGSPSKVSRKHVIATSKTGIVYVLGGKYTTYRKIALDALKKLKEDWGGMSVEEFSVYGSGDITDPAREVADQYNVNIETVINLKNFYGSRYKAVLELTKEDPSLKDPIVSGSSVIKAQIVYSVKTEMAQTAEDIAWRRLPLVYQGQDTDQTREVINQLINQHKNNS